ncbi:hypothetical protein [Rhodococcus rhodochrous]|uniref:Uncharacterized protein n=1 Tax=Rhodococcus rhodochrous TaxID=1829 RepID=A0AA47AAH2_RHORH|nr:hypothetical protein [Rhodococcus rhodochrous]UZF48414.1 hypothetical protein KUM34_028975 [Rhodococcus rhodochrous]
MIAPVLGSVAVQAFIDENTVRGIMVVAAVADPSALDEARRTLTALRLKGQERIHFKSERDTRRRAICSALVTLDIHVRVYHAAELAPKIGRPRCLEALVGDLAELPLSRLVLEQDDSTVKSDRRILFEATGKHGLRDRLTYHHLRAKQEPMLWIPDAVAWCLAKGGEWPARVRPLISKTMTVE